MDSPTSSHLYSKPQYQKILATVMLTNLSPNPVWLLRMAKRLPSKHTTSCHMRLMYFLEIKVEEYSYSALASDGSALVNLPILDPVACHSWNHDTAHFRPVDSDQVRAWVHLTGMTGNSSCVGLSIIITSESEMRKLASSFASFQRPLWME